MAVSSAIWLLWSSYFGLAMFAIVLGVNHGSCIAAVPAVLIELIERARDVLWDRS
jgi:hypothetical protein